MPKRDIILASASPRREELLSLIFPEFWVVPSNFDESTVSKEIPPSEHVLYSSLMKARDVACNYPKSLVIGADTIVVVDDEILGKPRDKADAARMLRMLNRRTHQVYTGIAVIGQGKEANACECTDVTFCELTDEVIARYISSNEPMDKAGAYAIQGKASVLIESINGCFFNVVGLPVHRLSVVLREFGIETLGD